VSLTPEVTIDLAPIRARLAEVESRLADASARGAKLTGERQAAVDKFRAAQLAAQAEVDTWSVERDRLIAALNALDLEKPATQYVGLD
jgi:hypothetical protein